MLNKTVKGKVLKVLEGITFLILLVCSGAAMLGVAILIHKTLVKLTVE